MDRLVNQDMASFNPGEIFVNLQFTAGTSGAVPTTFAQKDGIASVVLSATGVYTVNLEDAYIALLGFTYDIQQGTFDKTHGGMVTVTSTAVTSATAPAIVLQVRSTDGNATAVALTSGDIIRCTFRLARLENNG